MNNEPAGYFLYNEEYEEWEETHAGTPNSTPLYIHPAKEHFEDEPQAEELHEIMQSNAELTDEEIIEIVADKYEKGHGRYIDTDLFFIEFARAILRKAQK